MSFLSDSCQNASNLMKDYVLDRDWLTTFFLSQLATFED